MKRVFLLYKNTVACRFHLERMPPMVRYFSTMRRKIISTVLIMLVMVSLFAGESTIRNVKVSKSAILAQSDIDVIVSECLEEYDGIDILRAVADRINALYLEKGYPNAMAYIPEQKVEDGTALVELIEGRIGDVTVEGNTYTSDRYILKSLALESGEILNLTDLETKLHTFNRWNSGVRLTSTLNPGKGETGTTDIAIAVTENYPNGIYATFDNSASEATGGFRAGVHFVMNSLTGSRDRLLTGAYMNLHSRSFYADYSLPAFGSDASNEVRFGFKGSISGSEAAEGAASQFEIRTRTFSGSGYMTFIVCRTPSGNTTATVSANIGSTTTAALDTLLTKEVVVSGRIGISSTNKLSDNVFLSYSAGLTVGTPFKAASGVEGGFLKLDAGLDLRHNFADIGFILFSLSGQYMPFNRIVPNQEQMYVGGSSTVRGYSEGCAWGKDGFLTSFELHFLLPGSYRSSLFAFVDHAGVFPYTGNDENYLLGIGGGLEVYIGNFFHLKASLSSAMTAISQNNNPKGFKYSIAATISTPNI